MEKDQRIKKRFFPVSIFSLSLVFFAVITTIQMKIIGKYIHADEISAVAVTGVFGFWFLGSVIFTFFTGWQVRKKYTEPLEEIAPYLMHPLLGKTVTQLKEMIKEEQ